MNRPFAFVIQDSTGVEQQLEVAAALAQVAGPVKPDTCALSCSGVVEIGAPVECSVACADAHGNPVDAEAVSGRVVHTALDAAGSKLMRDFRYSDENGAAVFRVDGQTQRLALP